MSCGRGKRTALTTAIVAIGSLALLGLTFRSPLLEFYRRWTNTIEYDGRSFSYESLGQLALGADLAPTPLESARLPGQRKNGRPWNGTFVWRSHKTDLIIEQFSEGQRHGRSVGFHSAQLKHWDGTYVKGRKDGTFSIWDASGHLVRNVDYDRSPQ
jgi:hypothetical protein